MRQLLAVSLGVTMAFTMAVGVAVSREKDTFAVGYSKCSDWCTAHNKTSKNIGKCQDACFTYWHKNASDEPEIQ